MTTIDARHLSCTALQKCEDNRPADEPVTFHGSVVVNFRDELDHRGEDHVYGCDGIYPTGYDPDGTPRYDGPVCAYGFEPIAAAPRPTSPA